ncbi:MAG: hypothetical protein IH989_04920 [Planctomycetes bacterium]|nr:hypothetical protein [Planctomycetota bacterium]
MLLITFSGLDGCGKTTHVARTAAYLKGKGHRVRILESAHVSLGAAWSRTRRLFWGEKQDRPSSQSGRKARLTDPQRHAANRRLSGVLKGWLIYPIDSLMLSVWIRTFRLRGCTALVCDRYVYDKIVNLRNPICALTRLLLWLAPKPHLAFFLDADPDTARDRRPEHNVTYYTSRYEKYRRLPDVCPVFTPVPSTTVEEVQRGLERLIDARSRAATVGTFDSTTLGKRTPALGTRGAHRLETGATPD